MLKDQIKTIKYRLKAVKYILTGKAISWEVVLTDTSWDDFRDVVSFKESFIRQYDIDWYAGRKVTETLSKRDGLLVAKSK